MAASLTPRDSDGICEDFGLFQDVLKSLRLLDDRIVYALNTTVPTTTSSGSQVNPAERCKSLYDDLISAHSQREETIKRCVTQQSHKVEKLWNKREEDRDDIDAFKNLRKGQSVLREMQGELYVEEVVRDRTRKIFHERCRIHYIPTDSH